MAVVLGALGCVRVACRDGLLQAKAFAGDLVGGNDSGALGRHSPHWGVMLELHPSCMGFSRWKSCPVLWTSDNGIFGVVPSLETLSLETQLGLRHCW
jgi:hypothetical protein